MNALGSIRFAWTPAISRDVARRAETVLRKLHSEFGAMSVIVTDDALEYGVNASTTPFDETHVQISFSNMIGNRAAWDEITLSSEAPGFVPANVGTDSVRYVATHEFGHAVANYAGIHGGRHEYNTVSTWLGGEGDKAAREISRYAGFSPHETLAEAFAEFELSPRPRPLSAQIARNLIAAYRRKASQK